MRKNFILLVTALGMSFSFGQKIKFDSKKTQDQFISEIMSQMTLEEKLGQLNFPTSNDFITGSAQSTDVGKKIESSLVGGLFNIKGVDKIKEMQRIAIEKSRLGIPLLFGMDIIHGYETVFPIPLALSATFDMNAIEKSARISAKEGTADGIQWTFSPMVDVSRDPRWGRIAESAGEDPYLASRSGEAMIKGYQGNDLSLKNTMMATVKHFALYGASEAGRDYNHVDMSRWAMYNTYFPPYKAAVDAGVGSVMTSFNVVDGIPASGNKWLMTEVLRNQWGFKGLVVTDYTAINEMINHGIGDLQTVSAMSLNAGSDMDMVGEGFLTTTKKSLDEGKVKIGTIDQAVKRVLEAKYKLGLFEDPYRYTDPKRAKTEIFTKENRSEARKVAAGSMVLLKNDKQVLPLKKDTKIALVGPMADASDNMPGTWAIAARYNDAISLKKALSNKNIIYAQGANLVENKVDFDNATIFGKKPKWDERNADVLIKEAVEAAKKSDVIVAAVGESSEMSGESSSKTNLDISSTQKKLLQALYDTGKPVVVVLFTGRAMTIGEENEKATAILNTWFGGTEAGDAIADVLFGDVNPSGKLPITFPRSVGQIPIYYAHYNTGRPISKDANDNCKFEKYRSNYLDQCNTPLYPFGYGLSYTTFTISDLKLNKVSINQNESLTATVQLKNNGDYDGAEVVQLYIKDVFGSTVRPVRELKGFQKIFLKKGESKQVTFTIKPDDLKFYNSELKFVSEPGDFEVYVGNSSNADLTSKFTLN
ncbi:beta-glucosidase BglX [Empedobacter falsenii]|jgi:beta-glucosidase|uniref:Periplasmic beta-glucosidase n=2 Tax=Empedobacter TaxID=59734 RepID=A0A376J403_9FLAO|nr:beta-glucosidase BglX [Empedobacter brevis]MDM1135239.1 beta-glucosidase BglX [Empedobacter sp. R750]STE54921.1 Periplasmic beta-glucosidase precursor [Empedobacter falsenii]